MTDRPNTLPPEEIANVVTHGLGLFLSCVGCGILLVLGWRTGDAWRQTGAIIYGASMVALYAASTLYHSARTPQAKKQWRVADHCGIYLLIAGSYTPFLLGPLRDGKGLLLLAVVWTIALAGIAVRASGRHFRIMSVVSYLALGWLSVFLLPTLWAVAPYAVRWIVASGLAYTVGVIFYAAKFWRYNHAIWHIFVLTGSLCHFLAVIFYVLGE